VTLAHRSAVLAQKALTFQVLFAHRASEALAVIVVVHSFDPAVTGLDWVAASIALCCKQFIPISFAVRQAILQVKMAVAKEATTVGARKAFRVKLLADGVQTIAFDSFGASGAVGARKVSKHPSQ